MQPLSITDLLIPASCLSHNTLELGLKPDLGSTGTKTSIHTRGGKIETVVHAANQNAPAASSRILNGSGCFALPGFIDIHVHGGMGADTMDARPAALHTMAAFMAQHGVTAFCPTTMTAPHVQIAAAVDCIGSITPEAKLGIPSKTGESSGARILGAHVEGPYISPRFPGAQPIEYVRPPNLNEFQALLDAGPIAMITLAPEEEKAGELIKMARQRGVVVVIGHTNATYDECLSAVALGASQATHTFNAMSGLHHRRPGTLGAVLSNDAIDAQLIADNIHVHPAAMQILSRSKGVERTILITDAMRAAGLAEGEYTLGGKIVTVQDGACRLTDGTLAGSILTMDQALVNFMAATGLPLEDAWPTTSRNAARSLSLDHKMGTIGPGYLADLVLLDKDYEVVATVIGGQVSYVRDPERIVS